ncbi:hypothetical protein G9A89_019858 [Geosiphon pyriformis]|nr:hypothetical protein G9A89_019858 [Geosiphon pyriformis]
MTIPSKKDEYDFETRVNNLKSSETHSVQVTSESELLSRFIKLFGRKPLASDSSSPPITSNNFTKTRKPPKPVQTGGKQKKITLKVENKKEIGPKHEVDLLLFEELSAEEDDGFQFPTDKITNKTTAKATPSVTEKKLDTVISAVMGKEAKIGSITGYGGDEDDANFLVRQLQDEVKLETKYTKTTKEMDKELMARYKGLKQGPGGEIPIKIDKLVLSRPAKTKNGKVTFPDKKNVIESPKLGPPPKPVDFTEFGYSLDDDSYNWCCICNADATYKCQDCDGDLFCEGCFKHDHLSKYAASDMKRHKYERFKANNTLTRSSSTKKNGDKQYKGLY